MSGQTVHLNPSNSSLSNSSNMTTAEDWDQHVDGMSSCLSWDLSYSEKTFLAFFLVFLGCVLFASTANVFLLFLTVRFQQLLWQPQYVLLKHISACGVGVSLVTALAVLSSLARKQTQIYGCWCIAQFCILRSFFLMSQMTLALMAVERYIFICHGIHYLRMITTRNVHISMGLVWLLSGAVSLHGGLVLSQPQRGSQEPTSGLLCDAFTIKEHVPFSREEVMLVFSPPTVIMIVCVLSICYCYGCMYYTALRVTRTLMRDNHRANRTVGFYFLMFLLQLALNTLFIILTMTGTRKAFSCGTITSIVTPLLIVTPSCVNAAFHLMRNPQIKQLVLNMSHPKCGSAASAEVEVLQQSRSADGTGERALEMENTATTPPPLPGSVSLSVC